MRSPARVVLLACVAGLGLAPAAAAAPAPMSVETVRAGAAAVRAGEPVRFAGRVVNRAQRRATGRLTVALRPRARSRSGRIVARDTLRRVRPGGRVAYRVRGLVPAGLKPGRYVVVACVRVGNRPAGCRVASRRLRVRAARPPAPPAADPGAPPQPGAVAPPAAEAPARGGGGGGVAPAVPSLVVRDGVTQRAFAYGAAIRQKVWVQTDVDTDQDGRADRVAVDVIRPAESDQGMKVPTVLVASPYWYIDDPDTETDGDEPAGARRPALPDQGRKADVDGDGLNDVWPGFYDNYFMPRGYAVALADSLGTGQSTGCPTTGGPEETRAMRLVVDWLNGRGIAYTAAEGGSRVGAPWATGKTGMVGLSYVGTLPNAVASTGVAGLETIVPQAAISDWYGYYRVGGLKLRAGDGPWDLANYVTPAARRLTCAPSRQAMRDQAGDDETDPALIGNQNPFWRAREYVSQAADVRASVFMVNGMNDVNVKPSHAGPWWEALGANDVPRRAWLTQVGHEDPFYLDRDAWLPELHRWFDHWLADVDNGVMDGPLATIEREPAAVGAPPRYEDEAEWPHPDARSATLWTTGAGLGTASDPGAAPVSWTDDADQTQDQAISSPAHSAIFTSEPLARDVRLSGTPVLTAKVRVDANVVSAGLGAMLVDYGPAPYPMIDYADGHGATWSFDQDVCMPEEDGSAYDSPCFGVRERVYRMTDREVVSRGAADLGNRNSLEAKTPLTAGTDTWVQIPLWVKDHVFPAGHRIGLVIVGSYRDFESAPPDNGALEYTLETKETRLTLPLVGGASALDP